MLWTTKQKDGTMRTLDTNNCTIFELVLEWFLMWFERKEKVSESKSRLKGKKR